MAERQGFEPWIPFRVYTLSKRAPSATRPSLRWENVLQKHSLAAVCDLKGVCQGTLSRRSSIVTYWQTALRGRTTSDPGPATKNSGPYLSSFSCCAR